MAAFLLDGMLVGLARRLRLMGYDCELPAEGEAGPAIAWRARAEGRVLVTVSGMKLERPPVEVFIVPEDDLKAQVRAVARRFPIDFEHTAFTRCSRDNISLEQVAIEKVMSRLPPKVLERIVEVRQCPKCGRLYWAGTHVEKIRRRMAEYLGEQ